MQTLIKRASNCMLTTALLLTTSIYAIPGVITVTNTNDTGAGSLRQAITDANSSPDEPHIINFSISSGVQVIKPASALPTITTPNVIIDGTTQPGWSTGNPQIILDGSLLTPYTVDGLAISGVNNCLIRGLVINHGFNNGVLITDGGVGANYNAVIECFIGTDHTGTIAKPNYNGVTVSASTNFSNTNCIIGSEAVADQGNLISGNTNCGVIFVTNIVACVVSNNYIGTDITGTSALPNGGGGVSIIGSLVPLAAEQSLDNSINLNLISGNAVAGILLLTNASQTFIDENFIGVDVSGTVALPNDVGIICQGMVPPDPSNPANGGVTLTNAELNVISGNTSHGMLFATNTTDSVFIQNFIGTDITGTIAIGNGGHGVLIQGANNAPCTRNVFGSNGTGEENIIANNGTGIAPHYGVLIAGDPTTPDTLNAVIGNIIVNNSLSAITLLNNSNNLQAAPTVINALLNASGNAITIAATAPSTPSGALFRLDFYINSTDRTPLTEGETIVGFVTGVPAGTTVVRLYPLATVLGSNQWVSATATNINNSGNPGDTSPYCANFQMATLPDDIPLTTFQNT